MFFNYRVITFRLTFILILIHNDECFLRFKHRSPPSVILLPSAESYPIFVAIHILQAVHPDIPAVQASYIQSLHILDRNWTHP